MEREGSGENALNAAGDYIRQHRGKGVPAALVVFLIVGAVWAFNIRDRVTNLEEVVSEIRRSVHGISKIQTNHSRALYLIQYQMGISTMEGSHHSEPTNPHPPTTGDNR